MDALKQEKALLEKEVEQLKLKLAAEEAKVKSSYSMEQQIVDFKKLMDQFTLEKEALAETNKHLEVSCSSLRKENLQLEGGRKTLENVLVELSDRLNHKEPQSNVKSSRPSSQAAARSKDKENKYNIVHENKHGPETNSIAPSARPSSASLSARPSSSSSSSSTKLTASRSSIIKPTPILPKPKPPPLKLSTDPPKSSVKLSPPKPHIPPSPSLKFTISPPKPPSAAPPSKIPTPRSSTSPRSIPTTPTILPPKSRAKPAVTFKTPSKSDSTPPKSSPKPAATKLSILRTSSMSHHKGEVDTQARHEDNSTQLATTQAQDHPAQVADALTQDQQAQDEQHSSAQSPPANMQPEESDAGTHEQDPITLPSLEEPTSSHATQSNVIVEDQPEPSFWVNSPPAHS